MNKKSIMLLDLIQFSLVGFIEFSKEHTASILRVVA
jgi:hypothetical protein